ALSWAGWERAMANATAAARYRVACIHFAAFVVLPALTVVILFWTVAGMGVPASHGSPSAELPLLQAGYREAFEYSLPWVALWFAGIGFMALRLALHVCRMARLPCVSAPREWTETVHRLARERMGVTVAQVQMANIVSPQVIGMHRPKLLLPRDKQSLLSAAEWEGVLLHELAHVRRGDYGWNLLQLIVLGCMWFHPAAWLLYGHVSREREACCDAMAVEQGASATGLARALIRLAESHARPGLGLAMSGQGEFTARVHRLLGIRRLGRISTSLRIASVSASVLCLLALGMGRLAQADSSLADIYNASAFGPVISVDAHDEAGSFALQIRQGRVIEASVGELQLPRDRIVQQDDRVTLVGIMREPIVALTVTPQGRIEWKARH
ncbi:MAG TPA: M56 family metallopeptidase, partial [Dyella sp.]|uniref:M56 family metallopeptidase n=1 Tax=Dyella sp. TaxID=1869338 RepID=UPI002F922533